MKPVLQAQAPEAQATQAAISATPHLQVEEAAMQADIRANVEDDAAIAAELQREEEETAGLAPGTAATRPDLLAAASAVAAAREEERRAEEDDDESWAEEEIQRGSTSKGGLMQIKVRVPDGCGEGDTLEVVAPSGDLIHVLVPPGHGPGSLLTIKDPKSSGSPKIEAAHAPLLGPMGDAAAAQKLAPGVSRRSRLAGLGVAKPWQVVGGEATGGIIVRTGPDTNSPKLNVRLSTGALVQELEVNGDRLHYALQAGRGPSTGWVSIRLGEKELLVRAEHADHKEGAKPGASPLVVQEARALPLRPAALPQLHASSESEANDAPSNPAKETQAEEEDSAETFWQLGKLSEEDATIATDLQTAVQSMCVPGRFSYGDLSSLGQAMVAERAKRSSMAEKHCVPRARLVQVQQRSEGGPENLLYQSLVERHTLEQWEAQLEKLVSGYSVMKVARNGKLYNRSFWLAGGSLRTNGRFNSGIDLRHLTGVFCGAVSQEFIKLRRQEREPPKKSGSLAGGLLRTFVASKPMTQEHPDPEEAGVVIIATGGRSFSLLFLGGAAERDEFAETITWCVQRVRREMGRPFKF
ncbi:unnamed protein product [Symbiodinium necroappetens]|uniref:Uncharacterized protein n=1 Tax=Symbiodinium necroappetens TaxID=1628268 RepID=A0A812ZG27_9DINO|nr:unnamed protein product [Symbiodinium necroappetens]